MKGIYHRMIAHDKIGFAPDIMDKGELEAGSAYKSREYLATLWMKKEITAKSICLHSRIDKPFKAVIIGATSLVGEFSDRKCATFTITPLKNGLRSDNPKIIGWMSVSVDNPVFIIRDDEKVLANFQRLENFLRPCIDKMQEAANQAAQVLSEMRTSNELAEVEDGRYGNAS